MSHISGTLWFLVFCFPSLVPFFFFLCPILYRGSNQGLLHASHVLY